MAKTSADKEQSTLPHPNGEGGASSPFSRTTSSSAASEAAEPNSLDTVNNACAPNTSETAHESDIPQAKTAKRPGKSKPGMERSLSQEQVVDAAFDMIDANGYTKFSMRALAEKLGMGTMSVYTYVPSKQQLLFLVIQKMMSEIDNEPIPGERWEDSLHRTCGSILEVNLRHANIRLMQMQTQLNAPQQHQRSVYYLHADQGMPADIYETMYGVMRSFLTGFIDVAAKRKLDMLKQGNDEAAGGEWSRISATDTDIELFHQGIDFIIAGTRALAAPDPCDWRTPENRSKWTWGREE